LDLVPDEEGCVVSIQRGRWYHRNLRVIATHTPHGLSAHQWEGTLVLNRSVGTRGIISWSYTKPPETQDFGAYEMFIHDHGEIIVFPAVPPLRGDHSKLILKRR
jgi:hypothetical protein